MKKTKWNQQSFFAMIKGNEKQNYCLNIKLVVFGRIQIITTNNQRAIFEWRKKNQGESLSQLFSSFSFHSFLAGWLTVMAYCHTLSLSLSFFFLFPISFNRIVVVEQTIKKSQVKRNFCQSSTHYESFFYNLYRLDTPIFSKPTKMAKLEKKENSEKPVHTTEWWVLF